MRFQVLGPVEARRGDDPVELAGLRRKAILAMLLLHHGRVVPTDGLIDAVWDGAPPATARNALQAHLSHLRRALGPDSDLLVRTGAGYALAGAPDALDAVLFEQRVAQGRVRLDAGQVLAGAEELTRALSLWRGPALADVRDLAFAHREAARLEELRSGVLEDRIAADLATGRHERVIGELEGLVRAEPFRERLAGQFMLALYRSGRQADALRAYGATRRRLIDELGIEPSPPLQDLEEAMLLQKAELVAGPAWSPFEWPAPQRVGPVGMGGVAAHPVVDPGPHTEVSAGFAGSARGDGLGGGPSARPVPPGLSAAARGRIEGRDEPLQVAGRILDRLGTTLGRATLLVRGEPGIGKTRLVAEIATGAVGRGMQVLWGNTDEASARPYQPVAEAIEHLVTRCGLWRDDPSKDAARRWLGHLVPGLLGPSDPPPSHAHPELDRHRLFEVATAAVSDAASHAPVVLVVDDVQWATEPTVQLLRHLVRHTADRPVLLILVLRDQGDEPPDLVRDLIEELVRGDDCTRLALDGLSLPALQRMVEGSLGQVPTAATLRELRSATGGNALLCTQVLRYVQESSTGPDERGATWRALLDGTSLPDDIHHVIRRRIQRLAPSTVSTLQVAAVLGMEFDLELAERIEVACGGPGRVLDGVEAALRANLVHEVPGRSDRLRFVHALVRQALCAEQSEARRTRIHRQAAQAAADLGRPPSTVAHHFVAAGRSSRAEAVEWLVRAAGQHLAALEFERAASALDTAATLLEPADPGAAAQRARLRSEQAGALLSCGRTSEAKTALDGAVSDARTAGRADLLVDIALRSVAYAQAGFSDPATTELLEECLAAVTGVDERRRAMVLAALAYHLATAGGRGHAIAPRALEALQLARELDDDTLLVDVGELCCYVLQGSPDLALQGRLFDEIEVRYPRYDRTRALWPTTRGDRDDGTLLRHRAIARLSAGDLGGFDADHRALAQLGQRRKDWLLNAIVELWHAMRALLAGNLRQAERRAAAMLALGPEDRNLIQSWAGLQFQIAREGNELGGLVPVLRAAAEEHPHLAVLEAMLAVAHLDQGDRDAAGAILERHADDGFRSASEGLASSTALAYLAEVCAELDDRRSAEALFDLLAPHGGRLLVVSWGVFCPGAADRFLALLADCLDDAEDADRRYRLAIALEASLPAPALVARTRALQHRARRRRGLARPSSPSPPASSPAVGR